MKLKTGNRRSGTKRSYAILRFTLTEILTVVAILAILLGIMLAAYKFTIEKAKASYCQSMIEQISIALEAYKNKTGYYPPQKNSGPFRILKADTTLIKLLPNYQSWKARGYIENSDALYYTGDTSTVADEQILVDPFGMAFWYKCPGYHNRMSFDLESGGGDQFFGYVKTSGHAMSWDKQFGRDHNYNYDAGGSYGSNKTHGPVIYYPDKQKDNIKNWK